MEKIPREPLLMEVEVLQRKRKQQKISWKEKKRGSLSSMPVRFETGEDGRKFYFTSLWILQKQTTKKKHA